MVFALVTAVALLAAGTAAATPPKPYVPATLLAAAQAQPNATFDVVVQGRGQSGSAAVAAAVRKELPHAAGNAAAVRRQFRSIDGVSARLTGAALVALAQKPSLLAITRDQKVVTTDAPAANVAPSISGTAQDGQTLTADPGSWSSAAPLIFGFQWLRCAPEGTPCTPVAGVGGLYALGPDDVGSTIRVTVTADDGTLTASATSDPTVLVAAAPAAVDPAATVTTDTTTTTTTDTSTAPAPDATATTSTTDTSTAPAPDATATTSTTDTSTAPAPDTTATTSTTDTSTAPAPDATTTTTTTDTTTAPTPDITENVTSTSPTDTTGAPLPDTPPADAPAPAVVLPTFTNTQLWPQDANVAPLWDALATPPAIAIVDSGIQADRPDFSGRVIDQVTLTTLTPNGAGDGRGHGTFVAGIAAGAAPGYAGVAPTAPLVSVDVLDDSGRALTSDVIAAVDWILANAARDNIRVANFSLQGSVESSIRVDPLDKAIEKLWLSGIVVVVSAGNYAVDGAQSGVVYAPGNDPFAITVGANDLAGTASASDDFNAPWSAWGYTHDGFAKPDLSAPGRMLIGPVPESAALPAERPSDVVAPGYMQLSGTSFAAPVVSGVAASILAAHPEWTPDQVKGALMLSALPTAAGRAGGVGAVDGAAAAAVVTPPNPNAGLDKYVVPDPAGGTTPVFDAEAWGSAVAADPLWNAEAWGSEAWGSAAWSAEAWGSSAWSAEAWGSEAWGSEAWGSEAWGSDSGADAPAPVAP